MLYKYINENFIIGVGIGSGGEEITEEEYNKILAIIENRPQAPEGYSYRLTTAMEWELCKLPPIVATNDEEIL